MKIGVISDTHDRIDHLAKALKMLRKGGVKVLIHCGDFCAPFMIEELAKFSGEVHCVFGNIDDRYNTPLKARELGINFHGDLAELEFSGRKIAVNHYPKIAEALASVGLYDAVFFGHNHTASKKCVGKTLLCNPGELMGRKGKLTFGIYDTDGNDVEIVEL